MKSTAIKCAHHIINVLHAEWTPRTSQLWTQFVQLVLKKKKGTVLVPTKWANTATALGQTASIDAGNISTRGAESDTVNFFQLANKLHINRSALSWLALAMLTRLANELFVSWLMLGPLPLVNYYNIPQLWSCTLYLYAVFTSDMLRWTKTTGLYGGSFRSCIQTRVIPWSLVKLTLRGSLRLYAPSSFLGFPPAAPAPPAPAAAVSVCTQLTEASTLARPAN